MNRSRIEFAACTIIAKNYLPMARVLADSWHALCPGYPFFVLLLDSPQGFFDPEGEDFEIIDVSQLSHIRIFLVFYLSTPFWKQALQLSLT